MKKIISIIGSIIVVLAVIYFGVTYYVTHQAKSWVKQASSAIQAEFPQVQSIDYQNIHASVLGLFSDRFTLHHLSIRLKGINVPVVVSQLTLTGISALSHKPTGNVTITAQGIHLNTLKAFLINQSQQSHDKQQQTWIEQIPASFNPNISITVRYDNDTHQVWINGSLSNQHHTYFTKNTTLDHAILNNLHETTAIEQALQQAYVSQSTSGVHINVDNIQLGKDNPEQDALLKQFGLETVSVHINGDGVYQDSDRMTHSQLMITASKLFTLKTHSTTHLNERLYLKPLIKWLNTPSKQRPALHLDEMIHHFSLTYQDQGLMPLLFNHVAPMIGGVQPSIAKRNIMNVLMDSEQRLPSAYCIRLLSSKSCCT